MPIDPKGTQPQPLSSEESLPEVNLKCRRGGCDSITAKQVVIPSRPSSRLYQCTKCKHMWGVNVGGHIDI